ncbi:MAG: hypothetical protein AABW83_03930 [Nanoarchaeota archaeon]
MRAIRLTKKIFDENKNGWFYLEDFNLIFTEGVIKEAYYGHGRDYNSIFGLHMELAHPFENCSFYLGNFEDISKLRYMTGVKRLYELKGKKVNIYRYGDDIISGFNLVNYNHKQLEFNFSILKRSFK